MSFDSMKKITFASALLVIMILSACRKSSTSPGSWTIQGTNYTAASASFSSADSSLTASTNANNPSSLTVYFPSATVKSGSYKIVNYTSLPLDSSSVYIRFINDVTSYYYFSTGNDNVSARVTVANGKISVNIPPVFLESYASPIPDSAQVSGTINQQ
jgi:hypothetical protein